MDDRQRGEPATPEQAREANKRYGHERQEHEQQGQQGQESWEGNTPQDNDEMPKSTR